MFIHHGLSPLPIKLEGIKEKKNTPIKNCYLSHRKALMLAKNRNWPFVCIFEDDAYPRNGIVDELNKYLSKIPDKCGVLILGNYRLIEFSMFNKLFFNRVVCWGSHAYVVFRKDYDNYIRFLDSVKIADCFQRIERKIINPLDFFIPSKNLFIQYSPQRGVSGINGYLWHCFGRRLTKEEIHDRGFPYIEELTNVTP